MGDFGVKWGIFTQKMWDFWLIMESQWGMGSQELPWGPIGSL